MQRIRVLAISLDGFDGYGSLLAIKRAEVDLHTTVRTLLAKVIKIFVDGGDTF